MNIKDIVLEVFDEEGLNDPDFWEKHLDRYHPDGIQEGSRCKYLGGDKANKTPNGNSPQQRKYSDADISNMEQKIKEFGIESAWISTKEEGDKIFRLGRLREERIRQGSPVSKEVYAKNLAAMLKVCEDLKKRFPNLRLSIDQFYPYDFGFDKAAALSTLDHRSNEFFTFITLGDIDKMPYSERNYQHKDERYIFDIIRHEIGHSLSNQKVYDFAQKIFSALTDTPAKEAYVIATLFKKIGYNAANFRESLDETLAELFSFYTDKEYGEGDMPFGLDVIVKMMLEEGWKAEEDYR